MAEVSLAIVGLGRVGRACMRAIREARDLSLFGVVRRAESATAETKGVPKGVPVVTHVSELPGRPSAALVCLPPERIAEAACRLLEHGIPIVECARLHGSAFAAHRKAIHRAALRHRTPAIVGAGWDPGAFSLLRGLFALLTPHEQTQVQHHAAASLHHTLAARNVPGVKDAVCTEFGRSGAVRRYVYVELEPGAAPERVADTIRADPLFLGEETTVLPVESVDALEEERSGVLLEREGRAAARAHQRFLLEARFDVVGLAAEVMLCAARALPGMRPGARSLFGLPLGALWGERAVQAEEEFA